MAWDAGLAMERLATTRRAAKELEQRKRESRQELLKWALGQGADLWKQLSQQKYLTGEREAAQTFQTGERTGAQEFQTGERQEEQTFTSGEASAARTWESTEKQLDRLLTKDIANADRVAKQFEGILDRQTQTMLEGQRNALSERIATLQRDSAEAISKDDREAQIRIAQEANAVDQAVAKLRADTDKAISDAQIASGEKISSEEIASREQIAGKQMTLQRELPGLETKAGLDALRGRLGVGKEWGMGPMQTLFGYEPSAYGKDPTAAYERFVNGVQEAINLRIPTLVAEVEGFLSTDPNSELVTEKWAAVPQDIKDSVLASVKKRLIGLGLKEDDPQFEVYLSMAREHMSYDRSRDHGPEAPAPIVNVTMPEWYDREYTKEEAGPVAVTEGIRRNLVDATQGQPFIRPGLGAVSEGIFTSMGDAGRYLLSGLTGGLVDIRRKTGESAFPPGVSAAENDIYAQLVAIKKLATGNDVKEVEAAIQALVSAPDEQVDMEKIQALIRRIQMAIAR